MSDEMPNWVITPEQLKAELSGSSRPTLVDVREDWEWEQNRIEGAKHIPLGELAGRSNELNPEQNIVVYCAHGMRSMDGMMQLRALGFKSARSLEGGIAEWETLSTTN